MIYRGEKALFAMISTIFPFFSSLRKEPYCLLLPARTERAKRDIFKSRIPVFARRLFGVALSLTVLANGIPSRQYYAAHIPHGYAADADHPLRFFQNQRPKAKAENGIPFFFFFIRFLTRPSSKEQGECRMISGSARTA